MRSSPAAASPQPSSRAAVRNGFRPRVTGARLAAPSTPRPEGNSANPLPAVPHRILVTMRRQAIVLTLLLSCVSLQAQKDVSGAARVRTSLEKLQRLGKILHIAAHPDDENTAFLALSALGWKYQTAY